jgi:O-Antigen ligase
MNLAGANRDRLTAAPGDAGAALARFGPWLGQAGLPFLLVTYLGLRGGGYDEVVRGEIGIAAWWVVLLGAAAGALPTARIGRAGWIALGLLAALAGWTALGVAWSESAERSVAELGRVAALLAVFALALSVQGPHGLRRAVAGLSAAVVLVSGIALLSRLHPAWFPSIDSSLGPEALERLHYPLNYWNGLAALVAFGIPLLLTLATSARHLAARALSVAALPALALTAFFTLSRGGALATAVALAVLFALHPRRLALLGPTLLAGFGSAVLIAAANQRDALLDDLGSAAAQTQGDEMLAMTLVVCGGVGLLSAALALAERHDLGPRARVSRRLAARAGGAAVVVALVVAIVAVASGSVSDGWEEFKNPEVSSPTGASRFDATSGGGRYQWWQSALDANATDPLVGIGPGTFEFWWAREGTLPGFVRSAHSLFFETLAELGIVGLVLVIGVIATPFAFGARRLLALDPERRILVAGALAACAAFALSAAIDWVWELTVLPVAFLLLTAALIHRSDSPRDASLASPSRSRWPRLVLPSLAIGGMIAIAIPLASATALRESQAEVRAANLAGALGKANTAEDIQPYAATPSLQQALVLELQGDVDGAVAAARQATQDEPTNWRTWLVRSRIEAQADNPDESVAAYREARSLNPRSPIFE